MAMPKFNNTLPILLWFVVIGWITVAGRDITALKFLMPMAMALGWFLLVPLLNEVSVDSKAVTWFQKAGLLGLMGAAFAYLGYVGLLRTTGVWYNWLADVSVMASVLLAFFGALFGFLKWK